MLDKSRHFFARQFELYQLARSAKDAERPEPPALVLLTIYKAVWEIQIPNQVSRFMSVNSGGLDDELFVVQVNAEAFYHAWLKSSPAIPKKNSTDCVPRSEMFADYKYKHAANGFLGGKENPVPLAEAYACRIDKKLDIGISSGITRSFWLIANRAVSFPVEVYGREAAELLNEAVGLDSAPQSLEALFAVARTKNAENMHEVFHQQWKK
jgi:hypothetical protein